MLQLVVPPNRSGSGNEYPMFIFCDGYSKDAQVTPKKLPPQDLEYSIDSNDSDMETEAFEIL